MQATLKLAQLVSLLGCLTTPLLAATAIPWQNTLLPSRFSDGLTQLQLKDACPTCPTSWQLDFYNLQSATPYRRETVPIQASTLAAYAYPDSHIFAMVQLELSLAADYPATAKASREAFAAACQHRLFILQQKPAKLLQKYQQNVASGHQLVELSEQAMARSVLLQCDDFSLDLPGELRSLMLWQIADLHLQVRIRLLQHDNPPFQTVAELIKLRQQFVRQYQQQIELALKQQTKTQR